MNHQAVVMAQLHGNPIGVPIATGVPDIFVNIYQCGSTTLVGILMIVAHAVQNSIFKNHPKEILRNKILVHLTRPAPNIKYHEPQ